jgi:hypothetical protein
MSDVLEARPSGKVAGGVKLTAYLHVDQDKMRGAMSPVLSTISRVRLGTVTTVLLPCLSCYVATGFLYNFLAKHFSLWLLLNDPGAWDGNL